MTAAVDLVAVRRAREALRAVAAARPELTATATRNRAEAWMHNQEHNQMSRKLNDEQNTEQNGAAEQIGVRLPAELLARLDAEATRLSALTATPFTRSMVVRSVLARALPPLDGTSSSTPTPPAPAAVPQEAAQSPRQSSTPRSTPRRSKAAAAPPAPAQVASSSSTPPADAPQEAAQSPRRSSTPRSTARRAKAAAAPPAPAPVVADDDEAAAIARHDERGRAHTELARIETLRADLAAVRARTGLSFKKIGAAVGCCDGSVIRFLDGRIQGWPTWGDKARAWLDALPPAAPPAPAPDLQRPLFAAEQGTP